MGDAAQRHCRRSGNGWELHHEVTGEKVRLPPAGLWTGPHSDEESGVLFVSPDRGEALWIPELLRYSVVDGFVHDRHGAPPVRVLDFKQRFTRILLEIRSNSAGVACYLLDHAWDGARLFWSFPGLWALLAPDALRMTCSRWYQLYWTRWEQRLVALTVPDSHLRRAGRTCQSAPFVSESDWSMTLASSKRQPCRRWLSCCYWYGSRHRTRGVSQTNLLPHGEVSPTSC